MAQIMESDILWASSFWLSGGSYSARYKRKACKGLFIRYIAFILNSPVSTPPLCFRFPEERIKLGFIGIYSPLNAAKRVVFSKLNSFADFYNSDSGPRKHLFVRKIPWKVTRFAP